MGDVDDLSRWCTKRGRRDVQRRRVALRILRCERQQPVARKVERVASHVACFVRSLVELRADTKQLVDGNPFERKQGFVLEENKERGRDLASSNLSRGSACLRTTSLSHCTVGVGRMESKSMNKDTSWTMSRNDASVSCDPNPNEIRCLLVVLPFFCYDVCFFFDDHPFLYASQIAFGVLPFTLSRWNNASVWIPKNKKGF